MWPPCNPGDSRESSPEPQFESDTSSALSILYGPTYIHTWLLEKPLLWLFGPLWAKQCICFLMLCSRFTIAFLPRNKHLLIPWLQSPSAVILEPKKRTSVTASTVSLSICHEEMGPDAMTLVSWVLSWLFNSLLSPSSRGSLVPLHFLPLEWYHSHIWGCWYFCWQSWF